MSWNTFSKETKRQAEAFNKIGKKYETVFGQNQNQIAAIEWLINQLPHFHCSVLLESHRSP
ncbi:MAG: hypothetical protein P8X74_12225 [Reinekea sp.]